MVRLVAVMTPMPSATMTPTVIQTGGTSNRKAAIARPRTRMMNPMTYVVNEDIVTNEAGN